MDLVIRHSALCVQLPSGAEVISSDQVPILHHVQRVIPKPAALRPHEA